MKKQFFSKLLMGALVFATVGFVSCKDYDDDISSLQAQINNAATVENLSSLQSRLDALTTSSEQNLKKVEEALMKGNYDAQTVLAELKAAAEKAGQDAADAIKAAQAAKTTADEAATAAAKASAASKDAADAAAAAIAAQKGVDANSDEIKELKAQLEKFAAAQQTYTTQAALKEEIDALKKLIDDKIAAGEGFTGNISLTADQARILFGDVASSRFEVGAGTYSVQTVFDATIDSIDKIWGAITSVSLYGTAANIGYTQGHGLMPIYFLNTVEKYEGSFPTGDDLELTANDTIHFGKDKVVYTDTIIVRVSPTNAQLTADMISLINSQGDEIDKEFIKTEVIPYTDLITTRADANTSGLWKVAFSLKDNYTKEEFKAYAENKHHSVLFAVAVNNTTDAQRRVVSEYDLYLQEGVIENAYDFYTDDVNVRDIHNRYIQCEDGTLTYAPNTKNHVTELVWDAEAQTVDFTNNDVYAIDRKGYNGNLTSSTGKDNRQFKNILSVEKGMPISINYRDIVKDPTMSNKPIRGFFVTLDWRFANESSPSEINAWKSYSYENVGVVWLDRQGKRHVEQPAKLFRGNYGTITINDIANVRGDIIGFRAFAVNYDGTLVDPDGRAFYVYVGDPVEDVELPVAATAAIEVTINDATENSVIYTLTADDKAKLFSTEANFWTQPVWADANPYIAYPYPTKVTGTATYNVPAVTSFWAPVADEASKYERRTTNNESYYGSTPNLSATKKTGFNAVFTISYAENIADFDNANLDLSQPNENTNYVKVVINEPRALLDNEVYRLTISGQYRNTTAVGYTTQEDIQKVVIKIKKVLPTTVPVDLTVKQNQKNVAKDLQIYMKPVYLPGYTPVGKGIWDIDNSKNVAYGKDIKPFDLADIFNNILDSTQVGFEYVHWDNWYFEYPESDKKSDGSFTSNFSYVGWYNIPSWPSLAITPQYPAGVNGLKLAAPYDKTYSVPYAVPEKIKDQSESEDHLVTAYYSYSKLSLTDYNMLPRWNDVLTHETLNAESNHFEANYICALEMDNIRQIGTTKSHIVNHDFNASVDDEDLWHAAINPLLTVDGYPIKGDGGEVFGTEAYSKLKAEKKAAAQKLSKSIYDSIFVVRYEPEYHDIPLFAFYYEQGNTFATGFGTNLSNKNDRRTSPEYLGLTKAGYANRSELPESCYLTELLSATGYHVLKISNLWLGGGLQDYYTVAMQPNDQYTLEFWDETAKVQKQFTHNGIPTIRLTRYRSTLEPGLINDLKGTLTVEFSDVFGHNHKRTFTITLLKPELKD